MNKIQVLAICALFFSFAMWSQVDIMLLNNFQPGYHLKQELKGDTLYLDNVNRIDYVVIYHRATGTDIQYDCFSKSVKIDLSNVVNGHYTVMVKTGDLIVLGLEVRGSTQDQMTIKIFDADGREVEGTVAQELVGLNNEERELKIQGDPNYANQKEETQAFQEDKGQITDIEEEPRRIRMYRVISIVDTGNSSYESEFNVFNKVRIQRLIKRNQIELHTNTGKKNKLVIYKIFEDGTEQILYKTIE